MSTITFSNILITPPAGVSTITAYAFVAADAESTDNAETLTFTTNGGSWSVLDQVPPISGSNYPTATGAGTSTFTSNGGGVTGNTGAWIVGTNSPTTVTTTLDGSGFQGAMFAVRFASLRLNKMITGARINAADQFKFDITATSSGDILGTGTSTGSGNGPYTAAAVSLASGIPLTIRESMATGSVSAITQYRSQINCINGTSGSSTVLPSNLTLTPSGGLASHSISALQFGDVIQCTFNNAAFPHLRIGKALGAGGRQFNTDQFIMRIQSGATSGPVELASTTTTGTGTTVSTGQTPLIQAVAGTSYTFTELASGTTVLAQYTRTMACTNTFGASTTTLPTTVPGVIAPQLGDVITCTITNSILNTATLTIVKSSTVLRDPVNNATNPKAIPGATVRYSITVVNSGTVAVDASTIFIRDTLPTNVDFDGTSGINFANGTTSSGLTWIPANDARVSLLAAAPTTFAGCATAVPTGISTTTRHICVRPTGTMSGATAAGQPSFTISFDVRIK